MRIFLFADRRLERDRLLRDLQHLADLRHRDVHPLRDLLGGRLAPPPLHERARGANQLVDRLDHVDRDTNGSRLVRDRAGDRLADPPRGVGRELVAAAVLELVDRLHQPDVAFLDQVEELQPAVRVLLRDRDDEAEVGLDELLLRELGLPFAADDRVERLLEGCRILLERVGGRLELRLQILDLPQDVLAVFFLELLLLVLRIELPLRAFDLALHTADRLDRVLHLVDQPALDGLGELDAADGVRELDPRAHRGPARAPVLALVPRRRALGGVGELFLDLLRDRARLADGVDLLLHLLRAFLDALVGDLLVVEDHQLANRALAGVELVAEMDDPLGDDRRPRDRLDDGELAALDAARDLDFAFAREERHRAHLAQVHPDRVVGLVERPRREVELKLLGPFARAVDDLDIVAQIFLVRVDDLDAGAAERVEEIVELVRGGDLGREQLVHLVVQQIAFFLADINQLPYFVVFFFDRHVSVLSPQSPACSPICNPNCSLQS